MTWAPEGGSAAPCSGSGPAIDPGPGPNSRVRSRSLRASPVEPGERKWGDEWSGARGRGVLEASEVPGASEALEGEPSAGHRKQTGSESPSGSPAGSPLGGVPANPSDALPPSSRKGLNINIVDVNHFNPKLRSTQGVPIFPLWLRRWLRAPGWRWTDAMASASIRVRRPRGNFVSSRKYTGYNFVPKFLLEQYKSPSNIVFTFLMIINFLPGLNVVSGWTAVIPLAFILGVALVKEVIEEIARGRADKRENERPYSKRIRLGEIEDGATSESLMQGDILILDDGDIVPCDMLYLGPVTAVEKRGRLRHPECVVSTASLDGEQSLKKRYPLLTSGLFGLRDWARVSGKAIVDLPSSDFKRCSGVIRLWKPEAPLASAHEWPAARSQLEPLAEQGGFSYCDMPFGIQNVLLRGMKLAGQKPVACLALYTGKNCKVFQSHAAPIRKRDAFDRQMNLVILFQFCVVVGLVLLLTLLYTCQLDKFKDLYPYLGIEDQSTMSAFFQSLGVHFILLAYAVPFSIFVTLQLIRLLNGLGLFLSEKFRAEKALADKEGVDDLRGMLDPTLARGSPVSLVPSAQPANLTEPIGQAELPRMGGNTGAEEVEMAFLRGEIAEAAAARGDAADAANIPNIAEARSAIAAGAANTVIATSGASPLRHPRDPQNVEATQGNQNSGLSGSPALPAVVEPLNMEAPAQLDHDDLPAPQNAPVDVRETEAADPPQQTRTSNDPTSSQPVEKAITVKDMSSVEKFSAVDIVFSDKTGTITKNKLSLEMIHWGPGRVEPMNSVMGQGGFPAALRNPTPLLSSEVLETRAAQGGESLVEGRTEGPYGSRSGGSPDRPPRWPGELESTGALLGDWGSARTVTASASDLEGPRPSRHLQAPQGQEDYMPLLLGLSVTPFSRKSRRGRGAAGVSNDPVLAAPAVSAPADAGGAQNARPNHTGLSHYISEFPDEGAIADALLARGYAVLRRSPTEVRVRDQGRKRTFRILGEKVFTSEDKMSVVVLQEEDPRRQLSSSELRDPLNHYQQAFGGRQFYVVKGAPSVVLSIVEKTEGPLQGTREDLAEFEGSGMRLITWAVGPVPPELWDRVPEKPPLVDEEVSVKSIADVLFDTIHDPAAQGVLESSYLCTTVLTDTLCDDLQLTIAKLRAAGIKFCLITGDSKRAAVAIALQGNLLTPGRHIQTYTLKNLGDLVNDDPARPRAQRMMYLDAAGGGGNETGTGAVATGEFGDAYPYRSGNPSRPPTPGTDAAQGAWDAAEETCLILEGEDADRLCASILKKPRNRPRERHDQFGLEEPNRQKFINRECRDMCRRMFDRADLVLCCGFTPTQKAAIVRLWQLAYREKTCLAVGDGQNDVQMLRQADIGIGITGKEGNSAANNSDVAVTSIKELERLIFVTGHYNLHRCTRFSMYMLYKNLVLASVLMFFSITTLFSAQLVIDSVLALVFNTLFNFFPIFVFSLFDRDIPESVLLSCPRIFREYKKRQMAPMMARQMALMYLNSIYQGCCIYYLSFACLLNGLNFASGHAQDVNIFGYYMISLIVFSTLIECIMEVTEASRLFNLAIAVSLILYISCLLILNYGTFFSDSFFGVLTNTTDSAHFWLCTLATTFAALVPEIAARSLIRAYNPTVAQLGREQFGGLSERQKNNSRQPRRETRPPPAPWQWWRFGLGGRALSWNKVRKSIDFPNVETRVAAMEERYGAAMREAAVRLGIESMVLSGGGSGLGGSEGRKNPGGLIHIKEESLWTEKEEVGYGKGEKGGAGDENSGSGWSNTRDIGGATSIYASAVGAGALGVVGAVEATGAVSATSFTGGIDEVDGMNSATRMYSAERLYANHESSTSAKSGDYDDEVARG